MSAAPHTAGPWYSAKASGGQAIIASETTGGTVAVAYDEKDAPLLAAAPEMLEALKDLLEQAELNAADDHDSGLSFTKAKAAISRAEGRAT